MRLPREVLMVRLACNTFRSNVSLDSCTINEFPIFWLLQNPTPIKLYSPLSRKLELIDFKFNATPVIKSFETNSFRWKTLLRFSRRGFCWECNKSFECFMLSIKLLCAQTQNAFIYDNMSIGVLKAYKTSWELFDLRREFVNIFWVFSGKSILAYAFSWDYWLKALIVPAELISWNNLIDSDRKVHLCKLDDV